MTPLYGNPSGVLPADRRIIVLTGAELRHTFFRKWVALSTEFSVLRAYCEGTEKSLGAVVQAQAENRLRMQHLRAREQSEEDFFRVFVETSGDRSNPVFLPKGQINDEMFVREITETNPDIIIAYGCSIIREPLLARFARRIINIHLGLSPYYRGSGTNYWPLVNGEPEFVGATFMYMDAGVDTGEIIHQIRARVSPGDTAVQIGNRLIVDMARVVQRLAARLDQLTRLPQPAKAPSDKYYRKKDYTEASVARLYANFAGGMVEQYLENAAARDASAPLVSNPALIS